MPDNRTEIDTEEKIKALLVSAYPEIPYMFLTEWSSDNADDIDGSINPNGNRFSEQVFNWDEITETNNEDPKNLWEASYKAIASANHALQAIEEMGDPESLRPVKAEALMARAYNHFVLVNVFCQHYTKEHGDTDLGIPYMDHPENELNPTYERGTVAGVYDLIDKDLQNALPYVTDKYYKIPKYHFNPKAAYAFAARFYLYYEKFDEAIKCADKVLGDSPKTLMKDLVSIAALPNDPITIKSLEFTNPKSKSNLMVFAQVSSVGMAFGGYYTYSRHNHAAIIATNESTQCRGPWGAYSQTGTWVLRPGVYTAANLDKIITPRLPYIEQILDPVVGSVYRRTVHAAFTIEETLLVRAEAYILKGDAYFDKALSDINLWLSNNMVTPVTLDLVAINTWANNLNYYEPTLPTAKKHLKPEFENVQIVEGSDQENLLQCLLMIRRIETIHVGLRWFDVKRYGMKIYRRVVKAGGNQVIAVGEKPLDVRDPRRALQLPLDVISAGVQGNPR